MSDATEQEQKRPLTLARPGGRLELRKGVETGQVRQSFSHGRSKTVTVEVRKKRAIGPGSAEPGKPEAVPSVAREAAPATRAPASEPTRRPVVIPRTLTAEERAGRVRALQDAKKADDEARRRAEIAEADRRRQEAERAAEEARRRAEEEARLKADAHTERARETAPVAPVPASPEAAPAAARPASGPAARPVTLVKTDAAAVAEEDERAPKRAAGKVRPALAPKRVEPRRRTGKLTITQALGESEEERVRSLASVRRAREREKQRLRQAQMEAGQKIIREVVQKFVLQLEAQLADRNVTLELSDDAADWLAKNGFDELYGARPLARVIQEQIKRPLADDILFGRLSKGGHVKVVLKDGKIAFEFDTAGPTDAPPKAPPPGKPASEPQEPALAD